MHQIFVVPVVRYLIDQTYLQLFAEYVPQGSNNKPNAILIFLFELSSLCNFFIFYRRNQYSYIKITD